MPISLKGRKVHTLLSFLYNTIYTNVLFSINGSLRPRDHCVIKMKYHKIN